MLHSASLVKLVPANIRKLYLNLEDNAGGLGVVSQSGYGVHLPLDMDLIQITRKKRTGKDVGPSPDYLLEAGDYAVITLGTIRPSKYQALFSTNPHLNSSSGSLLRISGPTIIEPSSEPVVLRVLVEVIDGILDLDEYKVDFASLYVLA